LGNVQHLKNVIPKSRCPMRLGSPSSSRPPMMLTLGSGHERKSSTRTAWCVRLDDILLPMNLDRRFREDRRGRKDGMS
jgi:hypothetical protein